MSVIYGVFSIRSFQWHSSYFHSALYLSFRRKNPQITPWQLSAFCNPLSAKYPFPYWTTRGYANCGLPTCGLDDSRTEHLADWSTRRLDNSRTGQVADWTTHGCHRRLCVLSFPFWRHLRDRKLSSPWLVQSASWLVRELSSPRVGNPRVGVSASCPVTVGSWCFQHQCVQGCLSKRTGYGTVLVFFKTVPLRTVNFLVSFLYAPKGHKGKKPFLTPFFYAYPIKTLF